MKLSTKARYGLKACLVLAEHYSEPPMSMNKISMLTGMSAGYLEQLFSLLRKDGIIVSERGAGGGYKLSRSPQQVSVGEILRSLEDGLELVDCISGICDEKQECAAFTVWNKLYLEMNRFLDSMNLQSLLQKEG